MHLGATWIVNHIGASCVPAVTFSRTETFPFSNEPAWQTTLPRGSGNEQVVKLTLEKPSHSWWYFRFWLGFFHEILTFLDHPADRSELLGELCVICRKNKCYYSFVLQPSRGSALSIWIFALSHFGKKTHFLSSFSCYPLLFWTGAPDIFGHSAWTAWIVQARNLERRSTVHGWPLLLAHFFALHVALLTTASLPHDEHRVSTHHAQPKISRAQKANPAGDGAETPNSCSISNEIIICNYFFDESWFIFCLWQSCFHLMLANWIL